MMVIFTSRSEKKSLATTRRILDSFADRIGNDTWQTIITAEGLSMVKRLLRRSATKTTAVACHWIRSRSRSELLWIVGNKSQFNSEGCVPVNRTAKDHRHGDWENTWEYLPLMKAVTAVAGLLHDWGKASDHFQKKLENGKKFYAAPADRKKMADPLRHEWVSCQLIAALVSQAQETSQSPADKSKTAPLTDDHWLSMLAEGTWAENALEEKMNSGGKFQFNDLPPLAKMICWLILSHHRMPLCESKLNLYSEENTVKDTPDSMLGSIGPDWGYNNEAVSDANCRKYSEGLLKNSEPWVKQLKKWAARLLKESPKVEEVQGLERIRPLLSYCRLALMMGDYYASSREKQEFSAGQDELFANTDKQGNLKQKLDEHLLLVMEQALKIIHALPRFAEKMEKVTDIPDLRRRSPAAYAWQDKAVHTIKAHRKENGIVDSDRHGWFIVNLAGTGCGKTIANAKIMRAISPNGESLRYNLALGLRSLTMQTGDAYRQQIHLTKDMMAVLIGSSAVSQLHDQAMEDTEVEDDDLLGLDMEDYEDYEGYTDDFLDIFFSRSLEAKAGKNQAFLYRPVAVTTIDQLMGATETRRGGRYMLPFLRLMSSDLVIDEIDDFSPADLLAITRLVHLAGMLGRSVAISSATIPPDLAKGMFKAYRAGWNCFASFMAASPKLSLLWCDEFSSQAEIAAEKNIEKAGEAFEISHNKFVQKRIKKLQTVPARRKGMIIEINKQPDAETTELDYFQAVGDMVVTRHEHNFIEDEATGKRISFGLVRMANIDPCVAVGKYLAARKWPPDYTVKVMVYHSRQVLLMRYRQEQYLDSILTRKNQGKIVKLTDPILRQHIDRSAGHNVIFVVVATPVEEVGRDHDFDWAIVEPSSYRSIIQLAGRVLRHRPVDYYSGKANVAILPCNLRGLREEKTAYTKPGFESRTLPLRSKDLREIVDVKALEAGITAVPRIGKTYGPEQLWNVDGTAVARTGKDYGPGKYSLIGIEHLAMEKFQDTETPGPQAMHGWLREYWWLTAFPQAINPFRAGRPEIKLCRMYSDGKFIFSERDAKGKWVETDRAPFHGITVENTDDEKCSWWLDRDYLTELENRLKGDDPDRREENLKRESQRFGEITIPEDKNGNKYYYSDQLGLYKKRGETR